MGKGAGQDGQEDGRSSPALLDRLSQFEENREILRSQLLEFESKEQNAVTIDAVEEDLRRAEEKLNNTSDPKSPEADHPDIC